MAFSIKNIFGKIKGFFNLERIISYGAVIGLIVALISVSKCSKDIKPEDCLEHCEEYASSLLIGVVDSLNFVHSQATDNSPKGDTVFIPLKVIYKRTATFVKNQKELITLRDKHAQLEEAHAETVAALEKASRDTLDELGQWFSTISEVEEKPIIETVKTDSSAQYQFTAKIRSRGELESYEHDLKVYPKTITITKKEVETLKRRNFLAIKGGYIWYDSRNYAFPFTLQYGRSIFTIEAGPIVNSGFKSIDGWQAQGGIVIKFK